MFCFIERQHEITSLEVISINPSENRTSATVQCVSSGDSAVDIRWMLADRDVTDLSSGQNFSQAQITSHLQVNFSMAVDVYSGCFYVCSNATKSTLHCSANVSCLVTRPGYKQLESTVTVQTFVGRIVYRSSSAVVYVAESCPVLLVLIAIFFGVILN